MSGPPSQAGRFKPRRPAKKISVGASTAASSAGASSTAPAAVTSRNSSGRAGGGRGRGRGRGGSRAPTPHGAVFFTGNADTNTSVTKRSSAASLSSTRAATTHGISLKPRVGRAEATEEFVVGELDSVIGSATNSVRPKEEPEDRVSIRTERVQHEEASKVKFEPLVDTYDSDSSEEGRCHTNQPSSSIPPTELPFPVAPLPVGIGGYERSVLYSCQHPEEFKNEKSAPVLVELPRENPLVSPFCDWRDARLRNQEEDSWFIFQFPTRLPNLKSTGVVVPDAVKSEEPLPVVLSLTPDTPQSTAVDVATPCTDTNCFDNSLSSAPAGRLGKIVVYKSGKTVLVMGGENDSPEVWAHGTGFFDMIRSLR